jgi:glutamine synthetase type III
VLHPVSKLFGEMVFTDKKMKQSLSRKTYRQFHKSIDGNNKELIDLNLANRIAKAMKK